MFEQRKKDILNKKDKSPMGGWDKKIIPLCEKINKKDNCYTTSSCAGRVVLVKDQESRSGVFEWISHDLIKFKELKNALNKVNFAKFVKFKQEPCLLHVACRDLKGAQELVDKAKLVGWKRSGIITTGKRFVVELIGTEKLEFLIMNNHKLLVNNQYLELVVKKSNENLKLTWDKINKLKKLI